MRILLAEDDSGSRLALESLLRRWGYDPAAAADGQAAWDMLQGDSPPHLLLLDWVMPKLTGLELCRKVRETPAIASSYIILLTARSDKKDIIAGLQAGADDYIVKPFDFDELAARLKTGKRILELQEALGRRVHELEAALARVQRLEGLLPICAWCKKVRNDQNYWQNVEDYLTSQTGALVSHGICPDCLAKMDVNMP